MFDFFSLRVFGKYAESVFNNPNLSFTTPTNIVTGELIVSEGGYVKHTATHKDFIIEIWAHKTKSMRCYIRGSFHKTWGNGWNHAEFYFIYFIATVNAFCDAIGVPPNSLTVHSFEIGVNITPPMETTLILESIKTFVRKKFERSTFDGNGLLISFDFAQYRVKIYDKGRQYGLDYPLLRVELKVKKMDYFRTKGVNITTLADFITGNWNATFGSSLVQMWLKLIIYPEGCINLASIKDPRTRRNVSNAGNPDYWANLTARKYNKQSVSFRNVISELSEMDLQREIADRIQSTWQRLTAEPDNCQRGKYDPYIYSHINPFTEQQPEKRVCKSCGRDITHQHPRSIFCSESIYGPAGKKCRNDDSNPRNAAKAKEKRRKAREAQLYPGPTLFPVWIHWAM